MKLRKPQLALKLDCVAAATGARRAGEDLPWLGRRLKLVLDTDYRQPTRVGDELHLPLPPAASDRQIRDAAESWLRDEAQRVFTAIVAEVAAHNDAPPPVALAFGKQGDWARLQEGRLRCQWRLIGQSRPVIVQVLAAALARDSSCNAPRDMFCGPPHDA